jgi:NADPH-dependent glutamate synthase beta subunit-like oxidoreductase
VNWYNSHPEFAGYELDLAAVKTVVIIGQGNVAVDCARVLAANPDAHLASSDISDYALDALRASAVKRVVVVGRRGHVQAAFTVKELRELTKLDGAAFVVAPEALEAGMNVSSEAELKERVAKRKNKLLVASAGRSPEAQEKVIELQFLRSPVEILPREDDPSRVGAVRLAVNTLEGPAGAQWAVDTGQREDIACDLVLKSVGYKVEPLDGVAFDDEASTVSTGGGEGRGRVLDMATRKPVPGLYSAGWAKRGPSGVVATNIPCARETVASIMEDAAAGRLPEIVDDTYPLGDAVVVDWDGFLSIDAHEMAEGEKKGKVRDKMYVVDDMMEKADVYGMRATSPSLS